MECKELISVLRRIAKLPFDEAIRELQKIMSSEGINVLEEAADELNHQRIVIRDLEEEIWLSEDE